MKKKPILIKAALLSLLPVLAGVLLCALNKTALWNVYLPASEWNDELFYFKQVESVTEHLIPQGFFGYNEGRAKYLSFATWNPLVMLPYILWGSLFGWNLYSPILCNMFLLMAAIFVFVYLTKPDKRQCIALAVLYLSSMYATRFCLSAMAETIEIFYGILFWALCISYQEEKKDYKLILAFMLVLLMAMGRPYFLILVFFPGYLWFRSNKWKGILGTLLTVGTGSILYVLISSNFCAPYLWTSLKTYWLEHYKYVSLIQGIKYTIKEILKGFLEFVGVCRDAVLSPKEFDGLALQLIVVFLVLVVLFILECREKRFKECLPYAFWVGSLGIIMVAMFLMYHLAAGRRHFVVFVTLSLFLISRRTSKRMVEVIALSVLLLGIYGYETAGMTKWQVPAKNEEVVQEYENISEVLENEMTLFFENVPNYYNTVLWVMKDSVNGEECSTRWQMLYAVPHGFGINCCLPEYVEENFDNLQCRYLATVAGGAIDIRCTEAEIKEILRTKDIVIYERYPIIGR